MEAAAAAAAEPLSESVTLVIKSPNQKQEDQLIEAQRSWSVQQLKAHLRQVFPGQPLEHEQKLIYSGKLLAGHLQLKDVLSKEKRHVLHLVCNSNLSKVQLPNVSEAKQLPTDNSGRIQESVVNQPSDGVRQRALPQNLQEINAGFTTAQQQLQGTGLTFPAYTAYSPQQLFWFQQMYARQYYMQYLAAAATAATTLATSASQGAQEIPMAPAAAPQPLPNTFPVNQPVNPDVPPPVNPGANQNLRMNAQGGLVDEEDEINRDWLDWVYTAARFSIFLSILYFYSSLSRFMMVMGAMILMYLHHAGWLLLQRRPIQPIANNPPPAAPAPAAPPNQDQNNNLQNENAREDHEMETSNERPTTSETRLPSPTFIKTAWVFFKTFFASLIPEGPPGIAN